MTFFPRTFEFIYNDSFFFQFQICVFGFVLLVVVVMVERNDCREKRDERALHKNVRILLALMLVDIDLNIQERYEEHKEIERDR